MNETETEMQACVRCNLDKPVKTFGKGNRVCRTCRRNHSREGARRALWEILVSSRCKDCKESDPVVLQFDHRDPNLKVAEVTELAKHGQRKKMLAEIKKCDIVCANCHTRRTSAMFGNWRLGREHLCP